MVETDKDAQRCVACESPLTTLTWKCQDCGADNDESVPECGLCRVTIHLMADAKVDLTLPGSKAYVLCPHCGLGIENVALNCTIYICGTTTSGQLPQHDEAYAAAATASGANRLGCGKQFRIENDQPVPCTGR